MAGSSGRDEFWRELTANRCTASKSHLAYPLCIFLGRGGVSFHFNFAMKYLNVPDPLLRGELKTLHAVLKQKPVMFHVKSFLLIIMIIIIFNFFGTE